MYILRSFILVRLSLFFFALSLVLAQPPTSYHDDFVPPEKENWKDRWCWGENHTECCNNITVPGYDCSLLEYNTAGCVNSQLVSTCGKGCDPIYGCEAAGLGYYVPIQSRHRWKCQPGTYCPTNHERWYTNCPIGTHQPEAGATSCLPCPIGTYQPYEGKPHCNECPEFSYQDEEGQSECKPCISGYIGFGAQAAGYDSNTGQMICLENEEYLPSASPSNFPSQVPSTTPSVEPTVVPSFHPSQIPSTIPSSYPSVFPSEIPSSIPSQLPSDLPSSFPTQQPSLSPSISQTHQPSSLPSKFPSHQPSSLPSMFPSQQPSFSFSSFPTQQPSSLESSPPSSSSEYEVGDSYVIIPNSCDSGYTGSRCNLCCDTSSLSYIEKQDQSDNAFLIGVPSSCTTSSSISSSSTTTGKATKTITVPSLATQSLVETSISTQQSKSLSFSSINSFFEKSFRINQTKCTKCPETTDTITILILVGFLFGVIFVIFYFYRKVTLTEIGKVIGSIFMIIVIEYFQILSLLSITKMRWPVLMNQMLTHLSIFRLENTFASLECLFYGYNEIIDQFYELHWKFIMAIPLLITIIPYILIKIHFFVLHILCPSLREKTSLIDTSLSILESSLSIVETSLAMLESSLSIVEHSFQSHGQKFWGLVYIFFYLVYLKLTIMTMEVFDCAVPDGENSAMMRMVKTDWICYEHGSQHMKLLPYALASFCLYTIGIPFFFFFVFFISCERNNTWKIMRQHQIQRCNKLHQIQNGNSSLNEHNDGVANTTISSLTMETLINRNNHACGRQRRDEHNADNIISQETYTTIREKYGMFYVMYKPNYVGIWGLMYILRKFGLVSLIMVFRDGFQGYNMGYKSETIQLFSLFILLFVFFIVQFFICKPFLSYRRTKLIHKYYNEKDKNKNTNTTSQNGHPKVEERKSSMLMVDNSVTDGNDNVHTINIPQNEQQVTQNRISKHTSSSLSSYNGSLGDMFSTSQFTDDDGITIIENNNVVNQFDPHHYIPNHSKERNHPVETDGNNNAVNDNSLRRKRSPSSTFRSSISSLTVLSNMSLSFLRSIRQSKRREQDEEQEHTQHSQQPDVNNTNSLIPTQNIEQQQSTTIGNEHNRNSSEVGQKIKKEKRHGTGYCFYTFLWNLIGYIDFILQLTILIILGIGIVLSSSTPSSTSGKVTLWGMSLPLSESVLDYIGVSIILFNILILVVFFVYIFCTEELAGPFPEHKHLNVQHRKNTILRLRRTYYIEAPNRSGIEQGQNTSEEYEPNSRRKKTHRSERRSSATLSSLSRFRLQVRNHLLSHYLNHGNSSNNIKSPRLETEIEASTNNNNNGETSSLPISDSPPPPPLADDILVVNDQNNNSSSLLLLRPTSSPSTTPSSTSSYSTSSSKSNSAKVSPT